MRFATGARLGPFEILNPLGVGGMGEAKSAYTDLLTLSKNADPDVPVVREARAEYRRLP